MLGFGDAVAQQRHHGSAASSSTAYSPLRGCDHVADQASETTDVAGGIDGIAETNDDEVLRWQHNDSLAKIAGCEKRVTRNPEPGAPLGMLVLPAMGPEPGAGICIECGAG